MRRRSLLVAAGGALSTAGCVGTTSESDTVPVWVNNLTSQLVTVSLDVRPVGGDEAMVSEILDLHSREEESVYLEPVQNDEEYSVGVSVAGTTTERVASGEGLRRVEVDVHSTAIVEIRRIGN